MNLRYFFALTLAGISLFSAVPAQAQQRLIEPVSPSLVRQGQATLWQSFTSRQRSIATAVANISVNYYNRTGRAMPLTQTNLNAVRHSVGASSSEASFVYNRMRANNAFINSITSGNRVADDVDRLINSIY